MWTRIEIVPSPSKFICLPASLKTILKQQAAVKFGGKKVDADFRFDDGLTIENSSFSEPGTIRMSDSLKKELLIEESLVYRVLPVDDGLAFGPVIGLLLGSQTGRYNPAHMEKYSDRFGVYPQIGGMIFAFSCKTIDWQDNSAYGLYYNIERHAWEYGKFPLPEVIYRRDFHSDPEVIKRLFEYTGGRLFNSYRFDKYQLFEYLSADEELKQYLPITELSTSYDQVKSLIDKCRRIILKPVDLSRGRGICIIDKKKTGYMISDYRLGQPESRELADTNELKKFFSENGELFSNYLVQQHLPLAGIGGSLFDVRVVMQKHADGEWYCTGIECRVSGGKCLLTNISKGGYALTLEEALRRSFVKDYEMIPRRIDHLCSAFCRCMDAAGEHFAEFGMDIAVDIYKNLWLIESNVFPSFKGFKRTDTETYLSIRHTPLLYALSLTQFGDGK